MKEFVMYDAHVKTAEKATQEFYREMGINYSLETSATLFRSAAEQWSDDEMEEAMAKLRRYAIIGLKAVAH